MYTQINEVDLKKLARILPFQLRRAIESRKLEPGKILCSIKRSSLEMETTITEEVEKYFFALGFNNRTEEEYINELVEGIRKVKEITENRNIKKLCFVVEKTNQLLKLKKVIEYVYRFENGV